MSVMIGIDPHKVLHAACAIDRSEEELGQLQVRSGPRQLTELLSWAARFEQRTWAIEPAGGLGYLLAQQLLAQQLLAHGEVVLDVPPTLSARVRVLGSGRSNKNDANDARAIAIAALRSREVFGIGPIIAATIIGYTGDITRFPTTGHYAAYNGTAPIEFSSSGRTVHRLSRRGNRTLNHAIHMIAVTQIRNPGSEGRTYFDRKIAEGRTKREAMRALKRQISDRVYRHLTADTRNK